MSGSQPPSRRALFGAAEGENDDDDEMFFPLPDDDGSEPPARRSSESPAGGRQPPEVGTRAPAPPTRRQVDDAQGSNSPYMRRLFVTSSEDDDGSGPTARRYSEPPARYSRSPDTPVRRRSEPASRRRLFDNVQGTINGDDDVFEGIAAPPIPGSITLSSSDEPEAEGPWDRSSGSIAVQRCIYLIDKVITPMNGDPKLQAFINTDMHQKLYMAKRREQLQAERYLDECFAMTKAKTDAHLAQLNKSVDRHCSNAVDHVRDTFRLIHAAVSGDVHSNNVALDEMAAKLGLIDGNKLMETLRNMQPSTVKDVMRINLSSLKVKVKVVHDLYKDWMRDLNARSEGFPAKKYHSQIKYAINNGTTAMQNMLDEYIAEIQFVFIEFQKVMVQYIENVVFPAAESLMDHQQYNLLLNHPEDRAMVAATQELLVQLSKFPNMGGRPIELLPRSARLTQEMVTTARGRFTKEFSLEPFVDKEMVTLDHVGKQAVNKLRGKHKYICDPIDENCHDQIGLIDEVYDNILQGFTESSQDMLEDAQLMLRAEMRNFKEKAKINW